MYCECCGRFVWSTSRGLGTGTYGYFTISNQWSKTAFLPNTSFLTSFLINHLLLVQTKAQEQLQIRWLVRFRWVKSLCVPDRMVLKKLMLYSTHPHSPPSTPSKCQKWMEIHWLNKDFLQVTNCLFLLPFLL